MENIPHDGLMRHLGVIGVRVVNRVVFPFAHISRKGFTVVVVTFGLFRLLGFPFSDEVGDPRVRTSCIVRRIAQIQDVLVAANGKAFDLAKLRILQFLAQFLSKVSTAGLVILERHAETSNRLLRGMRI